jgi:hypothetical protein
MYVYLRDHDIKPWQLREDGKIYPEDVRAMQILTRIDHDTQEQKRRLEDNERRLKQQRQP